MDDYPINYQILAEDFREQQAGTKEYNQGDGEWLMDALHKMCNAYDEQQDESERLRKEWRKADDGWIACQKQLQRAMELIEAVQAAHDNLESSRHPSIRMDEPLHALFAYAKETT